MDHKMARDDNSRLAAQLSETSIPWNSAGPPLDGGRTPATEPISSRRLLVAKGSYTTRHLVRAIRSEPTDFDLVRAPGLRARSGDVTLARVVEIGQHPAIEGPDSRRALLFPGDEILVAYGNRYAPDQFEAEVPQDLGMTHLVAAGGVAGQMLTRHSKMAHPTVIEPLGLLSRAGTIVNLASYAPHRLRRGTLVPGASSPPVVSVIGTSMDSGKTTAAGALIRGLTAAGLHVSAGKITGTGAGRDAWLFADSGAVAVLDFTDFGHPSTYQLSFEELRALFIGIVGALGQAHPDVHSRGRGWGAPGRDSQTAGRSTLRGPRAGGGLHGGRRGRRLRGRTAPRRAGHPGRCGVGRCDVVAAGVQRSGDGG